MEQMEALASHRLFPIMTLAGEEWLETSRLHG